MQPQAGHGLKKIIGKSSFPNWTTTTQPNPVFLITARLTSVNEAKILEKINKSLWVWIKLQSLWHWLGRKPDNGLVTKQLTYGYGSVPRTTQGMHACHAKHINPTLSWNSCCTSEPWAAWSTQRASVNICLCALWKHFPFINPLKQRLRQGGLIVPEFFSLHGYRNFHGL